MGMLGQLLKQRKIEREPGWKLADRYYDEATKTINPHTRQSLLEEAVSVLDSMSLETHNSPEFLHTRANVLYALAATEKNIGKQNSRSDNSYAVKLRAAKQDYLRLLELDPKLSTPNFERVRNLEGLEPRAQVYLSLGTIEFLDGNKEEAKKYFEIASGFKDLSGASYKAKQLLAKLN